jgi:hypothetical protein
MRRRVNRQTVDLSVYPDLVVIYLGMRVNALTGIKRLLGLGRQISREVAERPDGLLLHETIFYSLRHVGMRQYWRDFDSLEAWARSLPHKRWWQNFLRDPGGTGFWHEAYFMRGGMEAIYDDMRVKTGFLRFAPLRPARGPLFSARTRVRLQGEPQLVPAVTEQAFYGRGNS